MGALDDAELLEQLADAEHASWSHWMTYLFSVCVPPGRSYVPSFGVTVDTGDVVIPGAFARRWAHQASTPYADLSDQEQGSDREEVRKILPVIQAWHERQGGWHFEPDVLVEVRRFEEAHEIADLTYHALSWLSTRVSTNGGTDWRSFHGGEAFFECGGPGTGCYYESDTNASVHGEDCPSMWEIGLWGLLGRVRAYLGKPEIKLSGGAG